MFRGTLTFFLTFFIPFIGIGQSVGDAETSNSAPKPNKNDLFVKKIEAPIELDGVLNEELWFTGQAANNFQQYFPTDSVRADFETAIYMVYDDQHLYIGIKCYSKGRDYIVPSLRRDYRAGGNDNISLLFDTFDDGTNAFLFGINPLGVRREALISNGGGEISDFQTSWDNKWRGEAQIFDDYWSAELAIPFKTLRFKKESKKWRFNCYRFDTQANEQTVWKSIPANQWIFNLAFSGDMIWEKPLQKPGRNIALIPYFAGGALQDFEAENTGLERDFSIGGDAKIAVSSGLNLDLTINPDFSQVEVDRQVTNLTRFEIRLPERRQFFLENADLFGTFGKSRINPFFSRRIGIAQDTAENTISNAILYGARLSGKIGQNWRVGLLNMQTAEDDENNLPSYNYTVAAMRRKVFKRSNIGLIYVDKEALDNREEEEISAYNRVLGFDYNIANADNSLVGKVYYQHAFTPDKLEQSFAQGAEITYKKRAYSIEWLHQYVGENYDAEVGFVPRKDFFRINPEFRTFFYPNGILQQHGFGVAMDMYWQPNAGIGKSDHEFELFWDFRPTNGGRGRFSLRHQYTYLFEDFDPTRVQEDSTTVLLANTDYNYLNFSGNWSTDRRKMVSFRFEPSIGQFFNGFRAGLNTNVSLRLQPKANISLRVNYNYIRLNAPFEPVNLFLIGPRFDLTFTKKLFFTAFFQYNNQVDNFNINARLQWRFAPVSDMFLVYTDNYGTDPFGEVNRGLVFKVTYWLNL